VNQAQWKTAVCKNRWNILLRNKHDTDAEKWRNIEIFLLSAGGRKQVNTSVFTGYAYHLSKKKTKPMYNVTEFSTLTTIKNTVYKPVNS